MNETQIIPQLKARDEDAFKQLVDTFQEKVLNTCLGFVPNQHDAEDLVQDVFIEIFRSIDKFRGDSKLSTWIYRITTTKCLEHIRAKKRQKRKSFFQSLIGMHENADRIKAYDFNHPGVLLENKERTKILFEHIDKLSDNQRIAFTLHKIEGLSYQEITEVMETSLSSVESLIFRARKNLKKSLSKTSFLYTRLQERMKQQSESSVNTAPSRLPIWQLATVVVLLLANVFVLQQSGYFEAENTSSLEDFATEYALDESEEDLDYISVNE